MNDEERIERIQEHRGYIERLEEAKMYALTREGKALFQSLIMNTREKIVALEKKETGS